VESGIADRVSSLEEVIDRSKLLLLLVRPQEFAAVTASAFRPDATLISFMAGIPLDRLPRSPRPGRRARVLTSSPETLRTRRGIAAAYPPDEPPVRDLLEVMGVEIFALSREDPIDAFGALGSCLPVALAYWEDGGRRTEEGDLIDLATRCGLADYPRIVAWAREIQRTIPINEARVRYFEQAATAGGVTETMLRAIDSGLSLPQALLSGLERSRELGRG
jgi:pyrroline-5-carboxylate reductase